MFLVFVHVIYDKDWAFLKEYSREYGESHPALWRDVSGSENKEHSYHNPI